MGRQAGRQAERRESQVKVLDRLFEGGKRRREEGKRLDLVKIEGRREGGGEGEGGREGGEWLLVKYRSQVADRES